MAALPDEAARLVVYLSLVRDLKPRAIQACHPGRFASVADVYRVKRNALDCLRRSAAVRETLGCPKRAPRRRRAATTKAS
jgi:hypothetical protein